MFILREKSILIQNVLSVLTVAGSVILYILAYANILIIHPIVAFNLMILTLGLFVLFKLRKEENRIWESLYIFSLLNYLMLMVASGIYQIWSFHQIIDKHGIIKLSLVLFFAVTLYLTIAYMRLKKNYKTVKGNQRHTVKWRVNKKNLQEMMNSDQVYINLGIYRKSENSNK